MRRRRVAKLIWFVALSLALLGCGASTLAAPAGSPTPPAASDAPAFAMYPAGKHVGDYVSATIKAGESASVKIDLINTGKVRFDARTFAVDAHTAINGGFAAAESGSTPTGVTLWLGYPASTFTLESGKGVEIPLKINVPKDAAPGQYISALIMETADARAVGESKAFNQVIRQAMPVFITVPGTITPKFSIGDITLTKIEDGSGAVLRIAIENSGNVLVKPKGAITVSDTSGTLLQTVPVDMNSVYARDKSALALGLPTLPSGTYVVNVNLKDDATGVTASAADVKLTYSSDATPVPPPPVFISTATATALPSLDKIQFLQVDVKILNNGDPVSNARLTLHVTHDGQFVEDYSLSSSLALPKGDTTVQSRYIPATGWKSGSWAFTLTLETVDASGVGAVVGTSDLGGTIAVP